MKKVITVDIEAGGPNEIVYSDNKGSLHSFVHNMTATEAMIELAKQTDEELIPEQEIQDLFDEAGETALQKGERIHSEVEKQLEFYTEVINPKPQPTHFELCQHYGHVWDKRFDFSTVHPDCIGLYYFINVLEC